MRSIKFVYSEAFGEVEGMFDEGGKLLGTWSCNDASWRNEYFSQFMEALGVCVVPSRDSKLTKKLLEAWKE